MEKQQREIVVIGAGKCHWLYVKRIMTVRVLGVVGLSTAIKIQEHGGYKVTIVAETLPSDPKSIRYTSHWAVNLPECGSQARITPDPCRAGSALCELCGARTPRCALACLIYQPMRSDTVDSNGTRNIRCHVEAFCSRWGSGRLLHADIGDIKLF
jgi:hypothetical protein